MLKKVRPVDSVLDGGSRQRSRTILRVGHEVSSITTGPRSPGDNDTWWWNGKVQEVIKAKKESIEMWEPSVRQIATGRQTRRANKEATKAVAQPRREQ